MPPYRKGPGHIRGGGKAQRGRAAPRLQRMDSALHALHSAWESLGVTQVKRRGQSLQAAAVLVALRAEAHGSHLHLHAELPLEIPRIKLALWNLIHLNTGKLPYGQLALSATGALQFGGVYPVAHFPAACWAHLTYHLVQSAESLYPLLVNDYAPLPHHERDLRADALDLFRTELCPLAEPEWTENALAKRLFEALPRLTGAGCEQLDDTTFTVAWESTLTTLRPAPLPAFRRNRRLPPWQLELTTEVGTLQASDTQLWVLLNRFNAEAGGIAVTVRYRNRLPVVWLHSTLHPGLLTDFTPLEHLLAEHHRAFAVLQRQLGVSHRLRTRQDERLGIR